MLNSTLKKFISYYFIFSLFLFFPFAPIKAQSFTESFKYSTVPSSLHMDGTPSAFLTGGFGTRDGYNDANGNGYLRLTNTNSTQKSILWSTVAFSSAKEISASFEYYIHSGTGGDGIAFILFDENTPNPQPGEFGGSLGYAQANGGSGFTNGYLGIGIDEYGNFSSSDEGRSGGPGSRESAIVLRGKGSGISGYPYLTGAQTYASPLSFNLAGNDRTATDPNKSGFRKIDILLKPRSGGGFFVSVYLTHGNIKSLVINNYEYSTTAPPNLKFAITASTGLYTDFHEIRNLNVSSLYSPIANPDSFSGIVGVPATSADITANDNGTVNPGASLDKASVDLDLDTPGIQNSITVPEKGTFTYDSSTGKITFTPLNNTVEGSIQINYTFNDTYAKTSTVATITYTTIKLTGVNICPGDTGSLMIESSGARLTTTFSGHWNSQTDPQAFLPTNTLMSTTCNFSIISSRNYTATQFSVTQTGIYTLKMTDTDDYDGLAYIYSGNFVPGNCNGGGTWIIGDDDSDGLRKEPKLITLLQSGVTYTLISTLWANNIGVYAGDYTWTITPPPGGGFSLTPLNYWYTSPSGGIPIGWGTTFDPVGVANSGLADTNTAGTTMYYVGDETNAPKFPVSFTIKPETYAGLASSTPTVCLNTNLVAITHTTLNSTGIGSPTGLPSGITATWAANLITISGTPTVSGTFNYSIPLIGECGNNAATGTIIVPSKPATVERNESICFGGSYTWNVTGITYSTAGTYTKTNDGCTADQVLNLSIGTKPVTVATNENICFGKSYTWEVTGLTYSASGTYTKTNDGCTADQVLNLSIGTKPTTVATNENICFGKSYTWEVTGLTYSASGTYTKTNDGCTADQVLNLSIGTKPVTVATNENICFGKSYTWEVTGLTYSASGTYTKTNDGCTADQVLNLSIGTKPVTVTTNENICFGKSYTWEVTGLTYSASGTYTKTNDGCTADQILNLSIGTKPVTVTTNENICFGKSYTWEVTGLTYSASGTYTKTNDGCTADQVLNLSIGTKPVTVTTNENISFGKSYTWEVTGLTYSASGTYTKTNDGCTADQVLNLTVTPKPADNITTESICSGQSYTWPADGLAYNTSQSGLRITNNGCTADQVLNLTVTPKPADIITTESICFGQSYIWPADGLAYNTSQSGLRITNNGCTADQVLNLTVTPKPADIITTESICFGQSYTWPADGLAYNTSQSGLRITNDGCNADQVLNLTVTPKPADNITTESICSGQSYTWPANGIAYNTSQSGLRITNNGCTADQVLNLTVSPKPADIITTESICFGQSYTWPANGIAYNTSQSGLRITNNGCTADQVLNLTVTPKPADNITTESICSGQSYTWPADGLAYNTSQSGLRIINNGCTADQVLNLTVTPKPADNITTESICSGQSYIWPADGLAYNTSQSGLRITNNGCTADQVLNLTVTPKPATVVKDHNICFGNSYTWDVTGTTYDAAGTYTKTNDGCTADQVLNLTFALPLTSSVIANGIIPEYCAGDNNGEFGIDISGGIAPYNVSLNNSTGIYEQVIGTEHYFSNISGNTHIVYIKDALDCTFELQVSMPESVILNPVATVNYGCSVNSATITIEGSTDLLDVDYALDNGNYQRDNIFTNLSAGSHTITARHSTGCTQSTEPFLIKHMEPLELSLADGELNEIVATTKGGGGEYQYSFEDQTYSDNNKFIIYKSGNYKVTVTDKYGCSTTATQYLAYIDICIPIYFTPNGDGVNDEWGPDCTVNYKNLTYTIIDRYGREIANYNYGQKWDGKYNGKELTSGDYWYVIKLNDPKDNREFVGHFTLYR